MDKFIKISNEITVRVKDIVGYWKLEGEPTKYVVQIREIGRVLVDCSNEKNRNLNFENLNNILGAIEPYFCEIKQSKKKRKRKV
jgi:hypothetical protein